MKTEFKNTLRTIGLLCLCAAPLVYADTKLESLAV